MDVFYLWNTPTLYLKSRLIYLHHNKHNEHFLYFLMPCWADEKNPIDSNKPQKNNLELCPTESFSK